MMFTHQVSQFIHFKRGKLFATDCPLLGTDFIFLDHLLQLSSFLSKVTIILIASTGFLKQKNMELKQGDERSKWIVHSNHNITCFTEGEIERMTDNYKTILGRGAFGEVYRGVLEDNSVVAVKKIVDNVRENFDQELAVHREINHKNVVRLIGYCIDENALIMVTEYIPNGNLNVILHSNNSVPISLETRLRIATECAEALAYMHSYMYTQVIHGDIKPANILIDGSLRAKISDFGISRLVNDPDKTLFTERVVGSIGYMDPLFARDGRLTAKSDVYSFGVVLVELITRKRATTLVGEANIVSVFSNALANGVREAREIFDAEIASRGNLKILEGIAKLAGECMRMERDRRPEMIDVLERLRTLGRSLHQGKQQVGLFSWARKSKPTPPALVMTTWPLDKPTPPAPVMTTWSSDICRRFSLEEMKAATRNFDNSLRVLVNPYDEYTRIYCGGIDEGETKVAIMHIGYGSGSELFHSAIEKRSKLKHDHIVPLIGYCNENREMILVYDFIARGSLHHHLYNTQEQHLTWKQRLEICTGIARGMHYLHRGTNHTIIHGSLNSKNIFLDENWVAKIFDGGMFGDAGIWSSLFENKNINTHRLTEESDVHDIGALLFEVLFANANRDHIRKQVMLHWALHYKEEGRPDNFCDPALKGEINLQSLNKFVEIAAKCIADQEIDRPSMEDVLSDLECALQLQLQVDVSAGASASGS